MTYPFATVGRIHTDIEDKRRFRFRIANDCRLSSIVCSKARRRVRKLVCAGLLRDVSDGQST